MRKFQQGQFTPSNPDKYLGKRVPKYRSGWELAVMRMCDNHPAILGWEVKHTEFHIKIHLLVNRVRMCQTC